LEERDGQALRNRGSATTLIGAIALDRIRTPGTLEGPATAEVFDLPPDPPGGRWRVRNMFAAPRARLMAAVGLTAATGLKQPVPRCEARPSRQHHPPERAAAVVTSPAGVTRRTHWLPLSAT